MRKKEQKFTHKVSSAQVPRRRVTAIIYLNREWTPVHGGQLLLHTGKASAGPTPTSMHAEGGQSASAQKADGPTLPPLHAEGGVLVGSAPVGMRGGVVAGLPGGVLVGSALAPPVVVEPRAGRLLLFRSEIEHEVRPS